MPSDVLPGPFQLGDMHASAPQSCLPASPETDTDPPTHSSSSRQILNSTAMMAPVTKNSRGGRSIAPDSRRARRPATAIRRRVGERVGLGPDKVQLCVGQRQERQPRRGRRGRRFAHGYVFPPTLLSPPVYDPLSPFPAVCPRDNPKVTLTPCPSTAPARRYLPDRADAETRVPLLPRRRALQTRQLPRSEALQRYVTPRPSRRPNSRLSTHDADISPATFVQLCCWRRSRTTFKRRV